MSEPGFPKPLRISAAQVGTWQGLFALGAGQAPVSAAISAYNDGVNTAFISARLHSGAATDATIIERDFELPPKRHWYDDQVLWPGMIIEVLSDQPNVNFLANGI